MTTTFAIRLGTTPDGRPFMGTGSLELIDGEIELNGRHLQTRRVTLELIVAVASGELAQQSAWPQLEGPQ